MAKKRSIASDTFEAQVELWRKQMSKERPEAAELAFYTDEAGNVDVEVYFQDKDMWFTQQTLARLFDVGVPAISKHLSNVFEEGELEQDRTISILETVQIEGSRQAKSKA